MKMFIFTLITLIVGNLWAAEIRVESRNQQTLESILSVKLDSYQINQKNNNCDDDEIRDEDWVCNLEQIGRDSDLQGRGCRGENKWACFTTFKEKCTERFSGRTHSRTYTNFDGCFPSLSDCF